MSQLEINFGGDKNQLPIDRKVRCGDTKHISEIAATLTMPVPCKCDQCPGWCGCYVEEEKPKH